MQDPLSNPAADWPTFLARLRADVNEIYARQDARRKTMSETTEVSAALVAWDEGAVRTRLDAAERDFPGHWQAVHFDMHQPAFWDVDHPRSGEDKAPDDERYSIFEEPSQALCEFIAAAPTDLRYAFARIDALATENERLRSALRAVLPAVAAEAERREESDEPEYMDEMQAAEAAIRAALGAGE